MAKVEIKAPAMVVIEYHQEKLDKDYGSCLWASFVFDTENYELHITSDCGEYGYGWTPTPETESFLKLLSRMDSEYLLSKISDMYVVDTEETYKAIKEYIDQIIEDNDKTVDDFGIDMDSIYTACTYDNETDIVSGVNSELVLTPFYVEIDDFELYKCIVKDYPVPAKKIAEIFQEYIQPKIREMLREAHNDKN